MTQTTDRDPLRQRLADVLSSEVPREIARRLLEAYTGNGSGRITRGDFLSLINEALLVVLQPVHEEYGLDPNAIPPLTDEDFNPDLELHIERGVREALRRIEGDASAFHRYADKSVEFSW